MLNLVVHLAELGITSEITVYTSGFVFSGQLTSRKSYAESQLAFVNGIVMTTLFEAMIEAVDDINRDEAAPAPDYRYIHLRDCKTFIPGKDGMPSNGSTVRLRRSKIVGWSLGSFTPS